MGRIIQNKKMKYLIPLIIILAIGAFFRFYRIREYMIFLGDEGRDMLVVKRMIVDHKFTLLGPITSVGAMYMGPVYYYFMIPFLYLSRLDPVGPAIMVALFAVATIFLIYLTGRKYHPSVGLIASFLYAISPIPVFYGRSSWNPNIVPFFSMLIIYSLIKTVVEKKYLWFIVTGLSLGIIIQLHYVALLLIPVCLASLYLIRFKLSLRYYFFSFFGFLFAYSPFILFELRHGFVNTQSTLRFFFHQGSSSSVPFLAGFINTVTDVTVRLFWRLVVIQNAELAKIFIIFLAAVIFLSRKKLRKNNQPNRTAGIWFIWLVIGILSFGFYKGAIYDYYFGSLFAAAYLLSGLCLYLLSKFGSPGRFTAVMIFIGLTYFNLYNSPLKIEPNNLVKNTQTVAKFVLDKTEGKPYNFALISLHNSDHAYRYFLEIWRMSPVTIETPDVDPQRKTVTEQLLVVCEEKICQPLGHPLWEIAGFGRAQIQGEWPSVTTKVFKLVHYE